jgi:5'-3' exonuclease
MIHRMDRILLLDTYVLLHRAQVAFKDKPKKDIDTRYVAVFNFFRSLRLLIEQFQPHKVFAVLEGNPQFRRDIDANYKANRIIKTASKTPKQAEQFSLSRNEVFSCLQYLPITKVKAEAYEADDVILTLSADLNGEDITIISNDSDLLQIPQRGYKVKVYNPIKKEEMKPPSQPIIALKAVGGDVSDNIPALMGKKDTVKLLNNPSAFQQWMEIEENRANFTINRSLVELRMVPTDELIFEEGQTNFPSLRKEFERMSFASLIEHQAWTQFATSFNCIRY